MVSFPTMPPPPHLTRPCRQLDPLHSPGAELLVEGEPLAGVSRSADLPQRLVHSRVSHLRLLDGAFSDEWAVRGAVALPIADLLRDWRRRVVVGRRCQGGGRGRRRLVGAVRSEVRSGVRSHVGYTQVTGRSHTAGHTSARHAIRWLW